MIDENDLIEVPTDVFNLDDVRCETEWCRAKRRQRFGVSKYKPDGWLRYPDCGGPDGDYAGLAHVNRVARARKAKTENTDAVISPHLDNTPSDKSKF